MASVYTRISTPYQPNGTAGLCNSPANTFYAPGEIGAAYNDQSTGKSYLRVKLDSGATSATAAGVVAANQLAFWKDRSQNLVTNDKVQADTGVAGAVNRVAGIFQTAVTATPNVNGPDGQPLQYVCDIVINGVNVPVALSANTGIPGSLLTASAAGTATGLALAAQNTPVLQQIIGTIRATPANTLVNADITIGFVL